MRFKRIILASILPAFTLVPLVQAGSQKPIYPISERGKTADVYFGATVPDPYRWMEDLNSTRTHAWVASQNAYTNSYLAQFPLRDTLRARLTQLYNYSRTGVPALTPDGKLFYRSNTGLQNQSVLYMRASVTAVPVVVIDPNTLSSDGSIAFQEWAPSPDGQYVAYGLAQGGSDWRTVRVRNVATGQDLADSVSWVRFSGLGWTRDGRGFFYSRYPTPPKGQELVAALANHAVYYHTLGTPQAQDKLIFQRPELARYFVGCSPTDDGRYLFCSASAGADTRNRLYFADLVDPMHPNLAAPVVPIVNEDVAQYQVIDNVGSTAYILTDEQSPHRRVVTLDLRTPQRAAMRTVIPESKYAVESALMTGGHVALHYLEDVKSIVRLFDERGRPVGAIPLPGVGTVGSESGRNDTPVMFYSFASPLVPGTVYAFNVKSRETKPFDKPKLTFDPSLYETRQVFSTSKDGTRIPLFITMKRGTVLDGSHPTLLYAYGGFDVSLQPFFSPAIPAWIERGGVYVTASLRGGAEYGEAWHRAGMRERKQNVFDDFIGAAEYLVAQRYTSPSKLVMQGGSNGGLLIGAVSNQRPELFAVALPAVGVMDMLRYDKFTGGSGWVTEYGSSSDSTMFPYLYRYSPLQNIKPGTCYPATLATTADHDDRVVPSHTFKYIATLQAAQGCAHPVMVRVETQGSHGYRPTDKQIAETADELAFALGNVH
ncbi:MAG: prolyl oligopeptidase family serine peptidase [Gemmatimonadaceae bacterium]